MTGSNDSKNNFPTAGLILLRAEWFDSVVALPDLTRCVQFDAQRIKEKLEQKMRIQEFWTINSTTSLAKAVNEFRQSKLDLVILMFQVWAEDFYIQPLLEAIGKTPLVIWCYQPWQSLPEHLSFVEVLRGSGLVGTFEGLGVLQNLSAFYYFTWGSPDDERPISELECFAKAARVKRQLQNARIGILPYRNEQMQSTFVDEFRLRAQFGTTIEYLSVGDLIKATELVSTEEAQSFQNFIKDNYPIHGVTDSTLSKAVCASLGLGHLVLDHHLDVLSFNDIAEETHQALGLRPCLYPPSLFEQPAALALEGDLGAAIAVFILQCLSMSAVFFVEFWVWDEKENCLIGGHAGPQNPQLALADQVWISPDYEYEQTDPLEGAQMQFITKPGQVTLLQIRCTPDGWQAITFSGESLGGKPRLEGYPHALIRPDVTLDSFFRECAQVGTTQHFAMVYGNFVREIEDLGKLLNIKMTIL